MAIFRECNQIQAVKDLGRGKLGLDKVRAEFSLTALVYNLRRAITIVGVEAMMVAVRA
jgi:hypothetical protein